MKITDMVTNIKRRKFSIYALIIFFILGVVCGVGVSHDYMFNQAENWAKEAVEDYKASSRLINYDLTERDSTDVMGVIPEQKLVIRGMPLNKSLNQTYHPEAKKTPYEIRMEKENE